LLVIITTAWRLGQNCPGFQDSYHLESLSLSVNLIGFFFWEIESQERHSLFMVSKEK